MKYKDAKIEEVNKGIVKMLQENAIKGEEMVGAGTPEEKSISRITGFSKGIFLYGSTGVGKTHTLYAIKNRCVQLRLGAEVENWVELLMELRANLNYLLENVKKILDKDIVMIDDLGVEKQTEWSHEILYLIVNKAYERGKPLFISTNLSLDEFREKYGDRILSRLSEMCELVELTGEDRRIN